MKKNKRAIIIEGTRGVGKSTLTRELRNAIEGSTLINFTGFKQNGEEGLHKIINYYDHWMKFFELEGEYTFIMDRFFFSEMAYAPIYKNYDFTLYYHYYLDRFIQLFDQIDVYLMTVKQPDILKERLQRGDKALLFNQVEESVRESIKQQEAYQALFASIEETHSHHPILRVKSLDSGVFSLGEMKNIILTAL